MSNEAKERECCSKFDPNPWDEKVFNWDNKRFIKDRVLTFFYMPINFGSVIRRMMKTLEQNQVKLTEWMGLSDHTSKWKMDLYIPVEKTITGADNVTLSGKFYSKVYEGPYKNIGQWWKEFGKVVQGKGMKLKKTYLWYTTCPKCQKKYGKNYIVFIGEVE